MSQEPLKPHWKQPSHPDLFTVDIKPGDFSSGAISLKSLPAGSLFAKIETATQVSVPAYSSVQTPTGHIELNSDLVYINHSCSPSLIFDMSKMEVRVNPAKDLEKGQALTFFYPSSEWDMSQPFDCLCGSENCLGKIDGASHLEDRKVDFSKFWLNPHIEKLLEEKRALATSKQANGTNGHAVNGHTNGLHKKEDAAYEVDGRIGASCRELAGECGGGTAKAVSARAE